jgi:DNA-binding PadR family transcriptional regulator
MGAGRLRELRPPMQSPVNWALLGLVIERPSYAYELARRFERAYGGALSLSSPSHVYTALDALRRRSLIEEVPGTRAGRQPKPRYRATATGVEGYREWLVGQVSEDRRRQRLFVLQLATLRSNPEAALETIARYEQACLREAHEIPAPPGDSAEFDGSSDFTTRLLSEENRLAVAAKLSWVQYAREELQAIANDQELQRCPAGARTRRQTPQELATGARRAS